MIVLKQYFNLVEAYWLAFRAHYKLKKLEKMLLKSQERRQKALDKKVHK